MLRGRRGKLGRNEVWDNGCGRAAGGSTNRVRPSTDQAGRDASARRRAAARGLDPAAGSARARAAAAQAERAARDLQRRSEEHTSELQSHVNLVCRLLLEKKKKI